MCKNEKHRIENLGCERYLYLAKEVCNSRGLISLVPSLHMMRDGQSKGYLPNMRNDIFCSDLYLSI